MHTTFDIYVFDYYERQRGVKWRHEVPTRGKNNINIWLPVIIYILIRQLRKIFISKRSRSSSVLGCFVNWPDWNVKIIFRFFQRICRQPKRCFNADGKYVLMILNVVIHEHWFKREGKYCKFYFVRLNKSAYFQRQMWRSRKHDRRHVLFLKQIMQTTIIFFMYKTSLFSIHIKRIRDMQITPISNTRMFIYFVYCIIAHLFTRCHGKAFLQTPIYDVIGYRKILFLPRDLDPKRLKDVILEFGLTNSLLFYVLFWILLIVHSRQYKIHWTKKDKSKILLTIMSSFLQYVKYSKIT